MNVVVRVGISGIARQLLLLGGEAVFVPLIKNVAGANGSDKERDDQCELNPLPCFWTHHAKTVTVLPL